MFCTNIGIIGYKIGSIRILLNPVQGDQQKRETLPKFFPSRTSHHIATGSLNKTSRLGPVRSALSRTSPFTADCPPDMVRGKARIKAVTQRSVAHPEQRFDLVVIGAGSGGLAAAKRAASYGASVAIIEGSRVGGTCVIRGCVPKKLLVYGSAVGEQLADAPSYGWPVAPVTPLTDVLLANVRREVDRLNGIHCAALQKAALPSSGAGGVFWTLTG